MHTHTYTYKDEKRIIYIIKLFKRGHIYVKRQDYDFTHVWWFWIFHLLIKDDISNNIQKTDTKGEIIDDANSNSRFQPMRT